MRPRPVSLLLAHVLGVALVGAGCATDGEDSGGGTLPPEDTAIPGDSDEDTFIFDTNIEDTGFDGEPTHLLTMQHEGTWDMSPNGGPWTAVSGELVVVEYLDGNDLKPTCEVTFSLTGEEADTTCDTCRAAFELLYYVADGVREDCLDPELPQDGQTVRMGWSEQDETVYLDYQGSGVWLPWYPGDRVDDSVRFSWETTVGVAIPDEDP